MTSSGAGTEATLRVSAPLRELTRRAGTVVLSYVAGAENEVIITS